MKEINLLPPSRRRAMRRRATEHAIMGLLITLIIGFSTITIGGIISWAALWSIEAATTTSTSNELATAVTEYKTFRQAIVNRNDATQELLKIGANRIVWSEEISLLLTSVPANTTIERLTARIIRDQDDVARASIVISGQTASRDTLALFEERLAKLPDVRRVQSPPSNLLERTNIPYQFTLVLKQPDL